MNTTTLVREQPVMTVKEFATIFKMKEPQARNIFRASKTLNAFQIGGKWVCDYSDYLAFKEKAKERKDITLCFGASLNFMETSRYENQDMKLLLLNGASSDVIAEVLYGQN